MEITILQTIEEFTSRMDKKFGTYLVQVDDLKRIISRNGDKFYALIHASDEDRVFEVKQSFKEEMLKLLGE